MHHFLESLADNVLAIDSNPENHLVVLPTKRAAAFFHRIISQKVGKPSWLPETYTLNEWASHIAQLEEAEYLQATFSLYRAYTEALGSEAQNLPEFLSWSSTLMSDFNDISAYQINPSSLFRELIDYTEIDQFSFLNTPLSEKQELYRKFWKKLPIIFEKFTDLLRQDGLGTSGMVMSKAASECPSYLEKLGNVHVSVAGFNALSIAEKNLLIELKNSTKGKVYFDADTYLLSPSKSAGHFVRKNSDLGKILKPSIPFAKRIPKITVISAAHKLDQANAIASVINRIPEDEIEQTGLILADESMLVPIVERLPSHIKNVNVTMGLNAGKSSFAKWIGLWLEVIHASQMSTGFGKNYCSHLQNLVDHPFSKTLEIKVVKSSSKENPSNAYRDLASKFPLLSFSPNVSGQSLFEHLHLGLDWVINRIKGADQDLPSLRLGILGSEKIQETLGKLSTFPESNQLNINSLQQIFSRVLRSTSLSLIGEPMVGLQIMGVLETRALGFKNVLLCSVDEGNLPKKSKNDSFIPFEIRNFHQLPGKREREAVYAYQFYRLLSQSINFTAIYHTDRGALGGGGISRYLLQVEEDFKDTGHFSSVSMESKRVIPSATEKHLLKTDQVVTTIRNSMIQGGLSASSINRYYESPSEWYFTKILKLKEPEPGQISSAIFGTIVHESIETLFEPFKSEIISLDHLKYMITQVEKILKRTFNDHAGEIDLSTGIDRLHFETGRYMINAYLNREIAEISEGTEILYLGSEEKVKSSLIINALGEQIEIKIKGFIDRLERRNGILHLIDFKTGTVNKGDLDLSIKGKTADYQNELFDKLKIKGKALQLLLYDWLMKEQFPNETRTSQIISLPSPNKRDLFLKTDDNEAALSYFEDFLRLTAEEMLDENIPLQVNEKFEFAVFH